jgi:hypothetical protein
MQDEAPLVLIPYILQSNPHLVFAACIVRTACTPALSFGQTPALDRESNPHLPF